MQVDIALPSDASIDSCNPPDCSVAPTAAETGGELVQLRSHTLSSTFTGSFFTVVATVDSNSTFAWSANGVSVELQLPSVTVATRKVVGPVGSVGLAGITVAYGIPQYDQYDWTGGTQPNFELQPVGSFEGAEWHYPIWRNRWLYLSQRDKRHGSQCRQRMDSSTGALLGIAGGALVGAIQEWSHKEKRHKGV